jgi:photosystem II stability/assembly factor-like uncharacterized protein
MVNNAIDRFFSVSCRIGIVVLSAIDVQAKCEQLNSAPSGKTTAVVAISSTIFAGTNTGAYRSTDNGVSWEQINSNFTYCFAARGADIVASTPTGVMLSMNNGNTWKDVAPPFPAYFVTAVALIDTNIFAGTLQNGVFRSTYSGTSWTPVDSGLVDFQYLITALTASGTKLFAGTASGLCLSTNMGNNWSTLAGTGISPLQHINCVTANGSTIFVGMPSAMVRSTDSGTSWQDDNYGFTNDSSGFRASMFSVAVSQSYTFAGTTAGVFLSTDNGGIWTAASMGLPDYPRQVFSVTANNSTVFAGTANGVFVSTNNGTSWRSTITGIAGRKEVSPVGFGLEQNYPNPFNPSTTIRYSLPVKSHVTLTVFNTLGQQVATLVNEGEDAGYHQVRFDGSGLASGVYFYRLQAGTYVETKKLLLLR